MAQERLSPQPMGNKYIEFPKTPDFGKIKLHPDQSKSIESLKKISSVSEFLASADKISSTISKKFIPLNVDHEKALKVLDNHDFAGTNPVSKEYDSLLKIGFTKASIERQIIRSVVKEKKDSLDLSDTERIVLIHSLDIGNHYDRLYWQWRQNVVTSPLGKTLKNLIADNPSDPDIGRKYLEEHNAVIPKKPYIYRTYNQKEDQNIETLTYAQAFSEPIKAISASINHMLKDLDKVTPKDEKANIERKALMNYYQTFDKALTCKDPEMLEELYNKLDIIWFEIRGRMQPIHMIETYADPINIRVDPDYGLAFEDERQTGLNNSIKKTKTTIIEYLEKRYGDKEIFALSKNTMENSVAGIFTIIGSGRRIDGGTSGKNAPNRPEVRLRHGVKIFEDLESMNKAKNLYLETLSQIFGQKYVNEHFTDIDNIINYLLTIQIPAHELGHNFLIQENTKEKLGNKTYEEIEEDKADMVGVLITPQLQKIPGQQIAIQALLVWSLRMMKRRDNQSSKGYYNTALTYLKSLHEADVLTKDPTGFVFDDNPEKIKSFYEKTKKIFDEMADIYDNLDTKKANEFIKKYYSEEPQFIKDIHSLLGLKPRDKSN